MKKIKIFLCVLLAGLGGSLSLDAQKTGTEVMDLVKSQQFVFKAQEVNPLRGGTRQLSPGYDLTVSKNSVVAFLPYFGRAQAAVTNPSDGGIKFTSTNFSYKLDDGKKSWLITIQPNDASGVQRLMLTVFNNGTASLDIMSTGRDNISFSGYIQ